VYVTVALVNGVNVHTEHFEYMTVTQPLGTPSTTNGNGCDGTSHMSFRASLLANIPSNGMLVAARATFVVNDPADVSVLEPVSIDLRFSLVDPILSKDMSNVLVTFI